MSYAVPTTFRSLTLAAAMLAGGCTPVITTIHDGSDPIRDAVIQHFDPSEQVLVLPVWSDRRCHISRSFTSRVEDLPESGDRFRRLGLGWWVADGHGVSHGLHLTGTLLVARDGEVLWSGGHWEVPRGRRFTADIADRFIREVQRKKHLASLHDLHRSAPYPRHDDFFSLCFADPLGPRESVKYTRLRATPEERQEIVRFMTGVRDHLVAADP